MGTRRQGEKSLDINYKVTRVSVNSESGRCNNNHKLLAAERTVQKIDMKICAETAAVPSEQH